MDFLSFSISEVPKFFDQSSQNGEKNHFLAPASRVSQKFWGSYWSKILPDSVRASKTLQFGHQFHPDLSIQSGDLTKNVKNVKIDHQIQLQTNKLPVLSCGTYSVDLNLLSPRAVTIWL